MKKIIMFCAAFACIASDVRASTIIQVGDVVSGTEYVEILKRGVTRNLSIDVVAESSDVTGFEFISADSGKYIRLAIFINDFQNQFIKSYIELDEVGMKKLLANIKKIDATVEKALADNKKEKLFK